MYTEYYNGDTYGPRETLNIDLADLTYITELHLTK